MKKLIISTIWVWLPIAGCYVAELICKMIGVD